MTNIEKEAHGGKAQKGSQPESAITLLEKVRAVSRCWNGGEDPDEVLTQIYARHGGEAPPDCVEVIMIWDEMIGRLVADGDAAALRFCKDFGLIQ